MIVVASLSLVAAASGSWATSAGQTLRLGHGLGTWRLGMKRRIATGLVRTTRNRPTGMGCLTAVLPENASLVDYYSGLRLGWTGNASSGFRLLDVASTRAGDRTDAGFVVGASTLAQVHKRYPKAKVQKPTQWHGTALGSRVVVVYFPKGAEFGSNMLYWFDSRGVLRAIETNDSGC
jgi:hypothetical protein